MKRKKEGEPIGKKNEMDRNPPERNNTRNETKTKKKWKWNIKTKHEIKKKPSLACLAIRFWRRLRVVRRPSGLTEFPLEITEFSCSLFAFLNAIRVPNTFDLFLLPSFTGFSLLDSGIARRGFVRTGLYWVFFYRPPINKSDAMCPSPTSIRLESSARFTVRHFYALVWLG